MYLVVFEKLTKMLSRNLDFAPKPEEIPDVTMVMTEDIFESNYTDNDTDRVGLAIDKAGRAFTRYPTFHHIKQFIQKKADYDGELRRIPMSEAEKEKLKQHRIKVKNEAMAIIKNNLKNKSPIEIDDEERKARIEKFYKDNPQEKKDDKYSTMPDHIAKAQLQDQKEGKKIIRSPEEIIASDGIK